MADATWTVEVDGSACIGSGVCASIAPRHFVVENGRSRPLAGRVQPAEELRDVVVLCPGAAVLVHDEDGEPVE
ncbi:ferredoxin [Streptomyces sp. NPDC048291]|uniref:ferredoxin n=1 Tax=Streptomyces sp. NPDC048291 TaxID=3365530 RepID=UPI00371B3F8F